MNAMRTRHRRANWRRAAVLLAALAGLALGALPFDRAREGARAPFAAMAAPPASPATAAQAQSTAAPVDDARLADLGIRKLTGEHLVLYTDVPASPEVDELPRVFDLAFPQWCKFFDVPEPNEWRMTGRLIRDRKSLPKFREAGLLAANVPDFLHGWSKGADLWLYDQPTAYYRRHLLLHEGTHGFSESVLAGTGPPWYMEGVAELFGTHAWNAGQLETAWFPPDKKNVAGWQRIRIVRDAVRAGSNLSADDVFALGWTAHREDAPYGWCWAMTALLDGHPRYRTAFRSLANALGERDFNEVWQRRLGEDWSRLQQEWPAFVADLEYGTDVSRWAIDFAPGLPLPNVGAKATVAANKGWQSGKLELKAGQTYRLKARGRYQLGQRPKVWWSEPNGVSLRYYHGRPLGVLLAAVLPDATAADRPSPFATPTAVGLEATLTPTETGTLYLRVNDSAAELADNVGELEVTIVEEPAAANR